MSLLIAKVALQQELESLENQVEVDDIHSKIGRIIAKYLTEEMMMALSKLKKEVDTVDITTVRPDFNDSCLEFVLQELSDGRISSLVQNFLDKINQEQEDRLISIDHLSSKKSLKVAYEEEVISVRFNVERTNRE